MSRFLPRKERKHKLNYEINHQKVRLIGFGEPLVLSLEEALNQAENEGKDLILINENQHPPIVKIESYTKYLFELEKIEKERKKNSQKVELKEIQLSCDIHDHDLQTKSKKGIEFINDGDKVKVTIQLKGRQKNTPERGRMVMEKFLGIMSEISECESPIKLEQGKWSMILKPTKKK